MNGIQALKFEMSDSKDDNDNDYYPATRHSSGFQTIKNAELNTTSPARTIIATQQVVSCI
jgi:hypothetical protein